MFFSLLRNIEMKGVFVITEDRIAIDYSIAMQHIS